MLLHDHQTLSSASPHEIAFFINQSDTSGAFNPVRQQIFAAAFSNDLPATGDYSVDDLDVSLENILALSNGHPIDYLDISTHGGIIEVPPQTPFYAYLSTTLVTTTNLPTYAPDITAGRLIYGAMLSCTGCTNYVPGQDAYVFTPEYLTSHLTFNPGAIFVNNSCFGQNSLTAAAVVTTLQAAGVGLYTGWTKEVDGPDADETDAFLIDRLLGEQAHTQLNEMVTQDTPLQQPFPMTSVVSAINAQLRNPSDPLNRGVLETYATSDAGFAINTSYDPVADGTTARFVASFLPNSDIATAPIEYSMPSIFNMQVLESAAGGTLTILGSFPSTQGNVTITDGSGTNVLPVTSWSKTQVTAALPKSGNGSAGQVMVSSSDGIDSNQEPLTQWSGTLTYTENDDIPTLGGQTGSGTGTIVALYTLSFRSDVHPFAPIIEGAAVPQNLTLGGPMATSTVVVTHVRGSIHDE